MLLGPKRASRVCALWTSWSGVSGLRVWPSRFPGWGSQQRARLQACASTHLVTPPCSSHRAGHPPPTPDSGFPTRPPAGHGPHVCFHKPRGVLHVHHGAATGPHPHCGHRGNVPVPILAPSTPSALAQQLAAARHAASWLQSSEASPALRLCLDRSCLTADHLFIYR